MLNLDKNRIQEIFNFSTAVDHIKRAYIYSSEKLINTPDVTHLSFKETNGDCHIKSGYIKGAENYVIKVASGFYENSKKGLPSSNGMMLSFSASTGAPLAILCDEGWLTDYRTGIGGAIATIALARVEAENVLIIGTGIQAKLQVQCLIDIAVNRKFNFVFWGRKQNAALALKSHFSDRNHTFSISTNLAHSVKSSEIIITTTPSTVKLFNNEWVSAGTHITAVGADSPNKQELPVELVLRADLRVCDMAQQSLSHGEFQHAAKVEHKLEVVELGAILSGKRLGRPSSTAITVVDLTGIAGQDIAITQAVIEAAYKKA